MRTLDKPASFLSVAIQLKVFFCKQYFFVNTFLINSPMQKTRREQLYELPTTELPVECFPLHEVKKEIANMGKEKACGPDELPTGIEAIQMILEYIQNA